PQAWIIRLEPTLGAVALESLARPALLIAGAGRLAIAALFVRRRPAAALAAGAAVPGAVVGGVQLAHERAEPLLSLRPVARPCSSPRSGRSRSSRGGRSRCASPPSGRAEHASSSAPATSTSCAGAWRTTWEDSGSTS